MDKQEIKDVEFKNIKIDDLIALCYILDDYKDFIKNFTYLVSLNKSSVYEISEILDRVSKDKKCKGKKRLINQVKDFYLKNKSVIDIINKYSSIYDFMELNNDVMDERSIYLNDFNSFYKYLLMHKNKIEQILSLLEKIKELGFESLEFNEKADFTQEEYRVFTNFVSNNVIAFLDNMQVLPNYENNVVKYKTNESNYKIITTGHLYYPFTYSEKIQLNSLDFDKNLLPKLSAEERLDKIVNLKTEQEYACSCVRQAVDLAITFYDLEQQVDRTIKVIENTEDMRDKKAILEEMRRIRESIIGMCPEIVSTDDNENPSIVDPSIIEKEKEAVLAKRRSIHHCD